MLVTACHNCQVANPFSLDADGKPKGQYVPFNVKVGSEKSLGTTWVNPSHRLVRADHNRSYGYLMLS